MAYDIFSTDESEQRSESSTTAVGSSSTHSGDERTSDDQIRSRLQSIQRTASGPDDARSGPTSAGPNTRAQYERRYGASIDTPGETARLQQLEQSNTFETVQRWVDEGIPIDAMGAPSNMQAFRQRKDTPVPWDIEQQNKQSVQRSRYAARDTSPAGETQIPDSVRNVIASSGKSLDTAIQRTMESRMDEDFGDVEVYAGPRAAAAADAINARAFTVGNNIVFNRGEYDPSTAEGQHVLAHELAHVRQQTGGAVSMLPQDDAEVEIDPDPKLEREAEATAQRVMNGGRLGIQRLQDTDVHIQRMPEMGDAKVPPDLADVFDTQEEISKRRDRLKGWDPDTQTQITPAIEQRAGTCQLAAVQALLNLYGRDSSSVAKIIEKIDYADQRYLQLDAVMTKEMKNIKKNRLICHDNQEALETFIQRSGFEDKVKRFVQIALNRFERDELQPLLRE